jgi:SlyX protein
MSAASLDERLVDLETRLTHQDHTLSELNDVVTQQQASIMKLERLCQSMAQRISLLNEAMAEAAPGDERPPHY